MAMRAVGRVALVAALVVGAAACAGPRPTLGAAVPDRVESPAAARPAEVALVGDSLSVGEYATLPIAAEARGLRLDISAESGRRLAGATDELARVGAGRDLVVVALGTNDAEAGLSVTAAGALVDGAMAALGDDVPVLWLTVVRPAGTPEGQAADAFNAALVEASSRHPRLTLADWASFVAGRPELMAADGIHLTDDGYAVRTAWLVDHVLDRLSLRTA